MSLVFFRVDTTLAVKSVLALTLMNALNACCEYHIEYSEQNKHDLY